MSNVETNAHGKEMSDKDDRSKAKLSLNCIFVFIRIENKLNDFCLCLYGVFCLLILLTFSLRFISFSLGSVPLAFADGVSIPVSVALGVAVGECRL